jgi:LuxR family maltose regulon positive regulatory protein
MQNHPLEAQKAFDDALPFMLEAHNYLTGATAIFYQARLAYYLGQLDRAEALCREWKARFAQMAGEQARDNRDIPATRGLDIVLSLLLIERNQLDAAEALLAQSLDLLGWASWMELHGFIVLAHVRRWRGNLSGARETLQRMSRMGPQHAACAEAYQVLFDLKSAPDDPQARLRAENWVRQAPPRAGSPFALGIGPYHCDAEYFYNLAWSRVQLALGRPQAAAVFIEPALQSAQEHGLSFRVSELSIAAALMQASLGNSEAALERIGQALATAEPCGYRRVFDDGPEVDRLLHLAVEKKLHAPYAIRVLGSFQRAPAAEKAAGPAPQKANKGQAALVEPLSEREMEVLGLLSIGLSPAEVAKRLFLSPLTLKTHTHNIYAKLDVHTRIEAILKARELGLI